MCAGSGAADRAGQQVARSARSATGGRRPRRSTSRDGSAVGVRRAGSTPAAGRGRGRAGSPPGPRAARTARRARAGGLAAGRRPPGRGRPSGSPAAARRWSGSCWRQLGLRQRAAAGDRAEPVRDQLARWRRPPKTGSASSAPSCAGSACGGGDDRRVRQDPARARRRGGGRARPGPATARGPWRAARRLADPVHAGGAPPRLDLGGPAARPRGSRRTPARAHVRLALLVAGSRPARRAGRPAPRRRARRRPASPRAAAGCDQSAAEWSFSSVQPEQLLDHGAEADPLGAGQPAGELGVEEPRGRRPTSARQGRSWVAACSTHSASAMRVLDQRQVGQRNRVDQPGAGAVAAQLDQVGALAVAVAGGALGVDGDRAGAGRAAPRRTPRAAWSSRSRAAGRRGAPAGGSPEARQPPRAQRPPPAGAASASGWGVGSVFSCRPPSCRSSWVPPVGSGRRHAVRVRAGAPHGAGKNDHRHSGLRRTPRPGRQNRC